MWVKNPAAEAAPVKLLQADKRIDKRLLQTFSFIFQQQEKRAELNKPQYWISFRKWTRLITSESMRNQEATGDHFFQWNALQLDKMNLLYSDSSSPKVFCVHENIW